MEICPYCHRFSKNYETCIDCKARKNNYLEWLIITFNYKDWLKKLILKLKYYHKKDIWNFLADRLNLIIQTNEIIQNEIRNNKNNVLLTFVPSHRYRQYFVKWYNQSKILSQILAKKIWLNFVDLLKKNRNTKSQTSLKREKRLSNLENCFELKNDIKLKWNETILVVDDITTTSSTLNEIAKTIKTAYPIAKIRGIVLWRHW
jgi:ComF family protein